MTTHKEGCKKCHGYGFLDERMDMPCPDCHKKPETWEDRFTKRFGTIDNDYHDTSWSVENIIKFISSEKELSRAQGALEGAAQREREIVGILEGMKIKASGKDDPWSIQVAHVENQKSYNEALSTAISAISKKV